MRITILHTIRDTEDGFCTAEYHANACYEVGDTLATRLLANGHAEMCGVKYATVQWKNGITQRIPITPWIKDLQAKGAVQWVDAA